MSISELLANTQSPAIKDGFKVKYIGASDQQVSWGANDDPRKYLTEGDVYEVSYVEIHTWHTKISLKGYETLRFNSVSFEIQLF